MLESLATLRSMEDRGPSPQGAVAAPATLTSTNTQDSSVETSSSAIPGLSDDLFGTIDPDDTPFFPLLGGRSPSELSLPDLEPIPAIRSPSLRAASSSDPSLPLRPSTIVTATSRFSTVVRNRNEAPFIIDIESDEEYLSAESEDEQADGELTNSASITSIDLSRIQHNGDDTQDTSASHSEVDDREHHCENEPSAATPQADDQLMMRRPSPIEHDTEPPFVTDGRGRVVWSSMRTDSASQTANVVQEGRQTPRAGRASPATVERRSKTRRPAREPITIDSEHPSIFLTDGRGRVISTGSSPASTPADRGLTGARRDSERIPASECDSEAALSGGEVSDTESSRSFFGRVMDAMFSS